MVVRGVLDDQAWPLLRRLTRRLDQLRDCCRHRTQRVSAIARGAARTPRDLIGFEPGPKRLDQVCCPVANLTLVILDVDESSPIVSVVEAHREIDGARGHNLAQTLLPLRTRQRDTQRLKNPEEIVARFRQAFAASAGIRAPAERCRPASGRGTDASSTPCGFDAQNQTRPRSRSRASRWSRSASILDPSADDALMHRNASAIAGATTILTFARRLGRNVLFESCRWPCSRR
jgi:hypothetical protein